MALDRDDRIEAYSRLSLRPYSLLTKASVVKIGEELDAEQVVFGQYEVKPDQDPAAKSRGSLEITARVLDLKHVKQGPEFSEVGALEDLAGAAGASGLANVALSEDRRRRRRKPSFNSAIRRCAWMRWKTIPADCWRPMPTISIASSRKPPIWMPTILCPTFSLAGCSGASGNTPRPPNGSKRCRPETSTITRPISSWACAVITLVTLRAPKRRSR